jgi:hypothetical protein
MIRKLKLPALVIAGLVALYTLAGFFIVPGVARSQAQDFLKRTYGLDLTIGKVYFNPFTFEAGLERVNLATPGGERLLAFDAFAANFELRSLIERAAVFKSMALTRPYVHVHLRADGTLNLAQAFAAPHEPKEGEKKAEEQRAGREKGDSAAPGLIIDDVTLSGGDIHFTDNSRGRDFDQHFTPLDLHVQHFSTRPQDRSDLLGLDVRIGEQGRLTIAGDLSAIPTRFDVRLTGRTIPLAIFQPYLAGRLPAEIDGGALSFDLTLAQGMPDQKAELALSGQAAIAGLAVRLRDRDDQVLAWDELNVRGIALDVAPDRLAIDEITVKGLDTSFKIYGDGRTNIGEILQQATAMPAAEVPAQETKITSAPSAGTKNDAFPYTIGRIAVSGSRLLYGDEQIRPHVLVQIDRFAGAMNHIASDPETRTTLAFTGRVGEYGKADISGAARLAAPKQDLKAKVAFDNVELTSFSPYAGRFAGYTIDKGKLFLDLRYTLVKGRIKGENHAVFDQFELGSKVASEDATRLPVKFALSLLRDREGRIDIDLPVEGDADAPGFRFGPLIVKALLNLLTRIVTAPFDFIAGMFGGGPDMEYAVFEAGSGALPAAEHDKILPLSKALAARPRLIVEIQGWADPAADGGALRQHKLDDLLAATSGPQGGDGQKGAESGDGSINPSPSAVVKAYDAFFGAGSAAAVRSELAAAAGSPAGDGSANPVPPAVDPAAYEAELRNRLLAAQPVSGDELIALAYARGQQVMDALVRDGGVEADRVFVRRGEIAQSEEGTRAKLILDAR